MWNDLKFAARQILRNRFFAVVAISTLGLGIGASSAMFSAVYHLHIRGPAFVKEPGRLVFLWEHAPQFAPGERGRIDYRNFQAFKGRLQVFDEVAAFQSADRFLIRATNRVIDGDGQRVSANLLSTLGVNLVLGRNFSPEEDAPGGDAVALISHKIWKEEFGGDEQIVGKTIRVNDGLQTVIGVLPPQFRLPSWPVESDFLQPLQLAPVLPAGRDERLYAVGRLKKTSSIVQVQSQLATMTPDLREAEWNKKDLVLSVTSVREETSHRAWPLLTALSGAVGLALLIACSNVAILLLARSSTRAQEVAVRSALGASRGRVTRQFVVESMLLFVIAGVAGIVIAIWGCRLFTLLAPYFSDLPRIADISVNWGVVGFAVGLSLLTGLIFGGVPAWMQASGVKAVLLRDRSGGTSVGAARFRNGLLALEFALALVLLLGAGLMTRSVTKLLAVKLEFTPQNLYFVDLNLDDILYPTAERKSEYFRRLLQNVRSVPGIESAGLVQYRPLFRSRAGYFVAIEGQPPSPDNVYPKVEYRPISDGLFETLKLPALMGRTFSADDMRADSKAVVVNRAFASRFWPGENPVGKRLTVAAPDWLTVVGVVGDVHDALDVDTRPTLYAPDPTNKRWPNWLTLAVRSTQPAQSIIPSLRAEIQRTDVNLPVAPVLRMEDILLRASFQRRMLMLILQIFGITTLAITAVGVYGLVWQSVTERTREIGIRLVHGASPRSIINLFLRRSILTLCIGLGLGCLMAFVAIRFLKSFLFGIEPLDFIAFAGASGILAVTALIASYLPSRRAAHIDPATALRSE